MTKYPKFSVLMSIYKKEKPLYLKMALDSVLNQTVPPDEIVIVKDGPLTNELEEIFTDFSKIAPIKYIVNETNIGLSKSLNKGLSECSNNLVARMDTDDICFPNRFEKQLEYLEKNPDVDLFGSNAIKINEEGTEIGSLIVPCENSDIHRLVWTSPFIHPSIMFKKSRIIEIGSYNPNSGFRQDDYELWFRCIENGFKCANIEEPLIFYRYFSDNVKRNNLRTGIDRFKVGFSGCRRLKLPLIAHIGVTIPLVRSLLPYPLNYYFNNLMTVVNPRSKIKK